MFGAIWALIAGFFVTKDRITGSIHDSKTRNYAELDYKIGNDDFGTYYDYKGRQRDVLTNQRVILDKDKRTGDLIIYDKSFRPIRNVSEKKRKRKVAQEKAKGDPIHTAAEIGIKNEVNSYFDPNLRNHVFELQVLGTRYQDLETGKIYVHRRFSWDNNEYYLRKICETLKMDVNVEFPKGFHGGFFMDIESGLLVRISDKDLQRDMDCKDRHNRLGDFYVPLDIEKYNKFMNVFNCYQNIMKPKYKWNIKTIGYSHDYKSEREFNEYYFNSQKYR